ncbi:MAG: ArnT family glycosyltransferase, partial [Candidatus Nanoarchaeia archaeon]
MEELEEKESKETEEIKESNDVKETKEANKQEKKDPVDTKKIAKRKEKLKNFLNNPLNLTAVALLVIVIVTKLYYFSLTSNQPTWWDEGDYLAIAKELAIPSVESPEWWGHFTRMRPPIMPLVWSFFIKFGLSEAIMRFFTLLIPSILLIVLTYLLAESLFNKRVALISGFLIATYWVVEFYTHRLLTDIPALFLVMLSAYLFWEYYEKRKKPYGLYLSIFFGVLAFLTRFPSALVTMSALAYLIFIKKHKFFTDKHIWIAGFIGVATLIPYFLWNKISLGSFFPAAAFYGSENTSTYFNPAWNLFQFIPQFIGWPITALFLLGLIYALFNVLIGFDVVFKQKSKKCNKHLFLVSWLILQVIYFVFVIKTGNDRWMLT